MNNGVKRSIIAGCFAVVVALIYVFGARLFPSTAFSPPPTPGLTDCGNGYFVQQGKPCPNTSGGTNSGTTPTPQPTTPPPTPTKPPPTSPPVQACLGGNDYQLPSRLSGNYYFRVEFNTTGTWPEYETWLAPGTWNVNPGIVGNGHVWEFPTSCTADQLRADAVASHYRRIAHNPGATGSVLEPTDPIVTSSFTRG